MAVWLPTTKSRESMPSRHPIREYDTALERSRRGLQVWFRHRRDPTLQSGVMAVWNSGSPAGTKSGLHFGSPGILCHSDASSAERRREYYREYGGGILPSQGCGESKWVQVPVACPNTKRVQMDSNQLVLVCDAGSCDLKAWSLPSLNPWAPNSTLYPFLELAARSVPLSHFSTTWLCGTLKWVSPRDLGVRHRVNSQMLRPSVVTVIEVGLISILVQKCYRVCVHV